MPAKLVVTQYISLDGVIEDPVGMEGSGLGDWTGPFSRGVEGDRLKQQELDAAQMLLFGRTTYDAFAAVWPTIQGDVFADRMNTLPKRVVSTTLAQASWSHSEILQGDAVAAVERLKRETAGDILVYGSLRLVHALQRADLVDAYNLMVYPVVLGRGGRLFGGGVQATLTCAGSTALGDGIQWLRYAARR